MARTTTKRRPFFFTASTLLFALVLLHPNLIVTNDNDGIIATAKEIVATSEWKLLKEDDTIPAGLHVRMDLSTGKKWVKLIDDGGEGKTSEAAETKGTGGDESLTARKAS
mmetsp:Transcript_41064/g.49980  ORF Transcript_41064/g.49980 Transcript_41064/m.49980 type:complete len:110 (+) Transcript_41064:130-459(+)